MSLTGGSKFILTGGATNYQIARSLRFRSSNSAYLSRTAGTPTSSTTFLWSGWIKRGSLTASNSIVGGFDGTSYDDFRFQSTDVLRFYVDAATGSTIDTVALFRDPSAVYHVILAIDTTQSTQSNRCFIIVNGVAQTLTGNALSSNYSFLYFNKGTKVQNIGRFGYNATAYNDCYMSEINFVDGYPTGVTQGTWSASTVAAIFGTTNATTGAWTPKAYSGAFGNNGYYLPFSDNSAATSTTIGKDSSGNGNNWTPSGISVTAGVTNDSLVDTPTNYGTDTGAGGEVRGNYCTWNPLDGITPQGATFKDGNLDVLGPTVASMQVRGTFGMYYGSGKWYWEVTGYVGTGTNYYIGIISQNSPKGSTDDGFYTTTKNVHYKINGDQDKDGTPTALGWASYTTGDVIGCAVDATVSPPTIQFYKNGVAQGTATTASTADTYFPSVDDGSSQSSGFRANFGQRPFAYTAPAGFKALCTQNLADPAIPKPSLYVDVDLWTGTGATRSKAGLAFQPDLFLGKSRSAATDWAIYDAARGVQKDMRTNTITSVGAETTEATGLTAFNSDGYTTGALAKINTSAATYVAYLMKKGATPGYDQVLYTGNATNRTVAHSLGAVPKMIWIFNRTTGARVLVQHGAFLGAQYGYLNETFAFTTANANLRWNTDPTSSVFGLGTAVDGNNSGDSFVAHLWAEVAGFSKFGSFTGNASTDGPFVWCGFRPKFVLVKNVTTDSTNWLIWDAARTTYNLIDYALYPNGNNVEASGWSLDFLANGFKNRDNETTLNESGSTHIFAAFAESPFKYARAR